MLPFLSNDLYNLLYDLMSHIVDPNVMSNVKNARDLVGIDLNKQENLCSLKSINIGFAARNMLNSNKDLKELEKTKFRDDCKKFILHICKKFIEKSSLLNNLVRGASCLSPSIMLLEKTAILRIDIALNYLINKQRINAIDADRIKKEYIAFIKSKDVIKKLKEFDIKKDRLDTFLNNILTEHKVSTHFHKFFKIIIILFHGQAAVERSFSLTSNF